MNTRHHHPIRRLALLFALTLALVGAACSNSGDSFDNAEASISYDGGSVGATAPEPAPDPAPAPESVQAEAGEALADDRDSAAPALSTTGSNGSQTQAALPDYGRDIIFTAALELGATDVATATSEAIRTIEAVGGFVFGQDSTGGNSASSRLVFKVPPSQFQNALDQLGGVGEVLQQSVSADDVTSIVVDLQSRIITAEASVARLQDLLADADDIQVVAELERQLLDRETTLETLRGQLRTVQDQVDLATITVNIRETISFPAMSLGIDLYSGHDSGIGCFAGRSGNFENGDAATVCWQISNVGDEPITNLALEETALGLELGDLVVVDGALGTLEPGESVVLSHQFEADEDLRFGSVVTGTPIDPDGVVGEPLKARVDRTMRVAEAGGLPGFGEVLSGSWNALRTFGVVLALVLVAIAPFLIPAAIVLWLMSRLGSRWLRRRPKQYAPPTGRPAPPAPQQAPVNSDAEAEAVASSTS